jgi:hypothetical protein
MPQSVPLARIVPVRFEASGAPFAPVPGCRHLFEVAEASTALPLTSAYASTSGGQCAQGEIWVEGETTFEIVEQGDEASQFATPPCWFFAPI